MVTLLTSDKAKVAIRPSQLVQETMMLGGERFSIADYPYLPAIYDSPARELGLFTARQVAKSTFLASKLVCNAITCPFGSQILVSPLQEQAFIFATSRLKDFIEDSPFIKNSLFTGAGVINQALRKTFTNGHTIMLGYAQRTADRLRGRSIKGVGSILGYDEIQDILPDVIGVVNEMAFRAQGVKYLYAGTPKSYSNHMETLRDGSTACEWAVKCQQTGCKKWNLEWDERNIGNTGVICRHCGQPINTDLGQWARARQLDLHLGKDSKVSMEAFRIPQLIVRPIMQDPFKWRELLNKLRQYDTGLFRNEVLGLPHDSGAQPITLDQLLKCCDPNRPNKIPDFRDPATPPLVMGLDWAFAAENSYTVAVIGSWKRYPQEFQVYYYKIFKGHEADPHYQTQWVIDTVRNYGIQMVGADYGMGHVQNLDLIKALGEERVAQMWHNGALGGNSGGTRARWHAPSRKYILARTQVLTDTFDSLRCEQTSLPRYEDSKEMCDHILAESIEYLETSNRIRYVNRKPDDALHALTYCQMAGELHLKGDFREILARTPHYSESDALLDDIPIEDAWSDAYAEDMALYDM